MKFRNACVLLIGVLICTMSSFSQLKAQEDGPYYLQVDYLKVEQSKAEALESFLTKYWKPIHKERIATKEIMSWRVYKVQYPAGDNSEFNYVVVTVFTDFGNFDHPFEQLADIVARVHPDTDLDGISSMSRELRTLVKSEVFKTLDLMNYSFDGDPSPFLSMDYMKVKPSMQATYEKLETDVWKPIHRHRVEKNQMTSWALFSLQFPGGTNYPYTYATANFFDSWEQLVEGWPEEYWELVHPGADHDALITMTHEARDLVISQIWKLVEYSEISGG